jgi:hypothetical protein
MVKKILIFHLHLFFGVGRVLMLGRVFAATLMQIPNPNLLMTCLISSSPLKIMDAEQFKKSSILVKSLGFHPKVDSFNYELFDVDSLRLHVMDCVGALICIQKKYNKVQTPVLGGDKQRMFWNH